MAEVGAQFQRRTVNECWVIVRRQFHLTVHPASQPLAFPPHDRKRPGRKRGDCAQGADPAIDQQEGFLNGVEAFRADTLGVAADVRLGNGRRTVRAERVLLATGRRPNTDGIGLEAAGVAVNVQGAIEVDAELRTSVAHIFAGGDVIGSEESSQMATPVGARQGGIAAHNALAAGRPRTFDGRVVPRAIFTDPPIGIVGLTEAEAVKAGHRCWCRPLPMSLVPRANAVRDTRGIIKMVADADTGEVLGVAMIGVNASEVIHEAAMAMHFRAKLADFVDLLHVYPTMAEALKIAAISRTKNPAKLSCCAE